MNLHGCPSIEAAAEAAANRLMACFGARAPRWTPSPSTVAHRHESGPPDPTRRPGKNPRRPQDSIIILSFAQCTAERQCRCAEHVPSTSTRAADRAVPPRVIHPHRLCRTLERMTAVELEGLLRRVLVVAPEGREGLDRRGRQ